MTVSELVQSLSRPCQKNIEGRHVLAVIDISEINLQSHSCRVKPEQLRVIDNNTDVGFYLHPILVLAAKNGFPLELSTVPL